MERQYKHKTGIRKKVALFICLVALILLIVGVGLGYFGGISLMRRTVGEKHAQMAKLLAISVNKVLDEQIEKVRTYSQSPLWRDSVRQANLTLEAMEPEAAQQLLLDTPISKRLKKLVEDDSNIAEIFFTDREGGLVASSGRTSDFYQADEKWWREAFSEGKGKTFIGKISFDESADIFGIDIAMPMKDEQGRIIGICKAVLDLKQVFSLLKNFKIGETGHAVLIDQYGYILFHEDIQPFTTKFIQDRELQKMLEGEEWFVAATPHTHKKKMFLACAKVDHPLFARSGISWKVCIDEDAREVLAPVRRLIRQATVLTPALIILMVPLGFIFGGIFAGPIKKLHVATEQVSRGKLDYPIEINTGDEIEQLADSFKDMVAKVKEKEEALKQANKELTSWSETLEEKVEDRTKEVAQSQEMTLKVLKDLSRAKERLVKYSNDLKKALRVKSEFVSVVSHELRTPLAAIRESIAIILDGLAGPISKKQKDFLKIAKNNVDRLSRLVGDVLDVQKLSSDKVVFKKQKTDLNVLVKEVGKTMKPLIRNRKLNLIANLAKGLPKVICDRDKITQVLANLLNNAIKFTEKGDITIVTTHGTNFVQVSVKDSGQGIREEDLPKLFQQFEQLEKGFARKTGGTGLGLAICKEIIKKHRGEIWVESKVGKGTIFHFILPIKG